MKHSWEQADHAYRHRCRRCGMTRLKVPAYNLWRTVYSHADGTFAVEVGPYPGGKVPPCEPMKKPTT